MRGVVVVGAGHAGVETVAALRAGGYPGPVTLVAAERHAPYERPPLSKEMLGDGADPAAFRLRPEAFSPTTRSRCCGSLPSPSTGPGSSCRSRTAAAWVTTTWCSPPAPRHAG